MINQIKRFVIGACLLISVVAGVSPPPAYADNLKAQQVEFLLSQVRNTTGSLAGGTVTFYAAGTTTLKTVWSDRDKATPASNPYTLDANGTAQVYADGLYKVLIKNAAGTTVYTRDNLQFTPDATNNDYYADPSAADQGATTNSRSIASLLAAIGTSKQATIVLAHSGSGNTTTYTIGQNVNWSAYTNVTFKIVPGGVISHGAFTVNIPNVDVGDYQWLSGAGAVTFSGQMRISKPIWFGTDGTADQTEIQYAANALTNGGTLDLTGNFTITDQILVSTANTKVISNGGKITMAAKNIYGIRINADYCEVSGLTIDGTGYKDDGFTSSGRGAIHVTNGINYTKISNVTIIAAPGSGIIDDGSFSEINNVFINETGEHGIYCSSPVGSTYSNFQIFYAGKNSALTSPKCHAVKADGPTRSTFNNFYILDPLTSALEVAATAEGNVFSNFAMRLTAATGETGVSVSGGASTRNIFTGFTIDQSNAYAGFTFTTNSSNSILTDSIIVMNADGAGVYIAGANNTVSGNKIYSNYATTQSAIYVNASNTVVKNNEAKLGTGTWAYGVGVAGSIQDNIITDNIMSKAVIPYVVTQTNRDIVLRADEPIASVATTDATATNLYTFSPKASSGYYITAKVVTTGTNNAAYTIAGLFTTDGSAAPTQIGTTTAISAIESDAAFDCDFVEDAAGYIYVKVTGKAANTQTWKLQSFDWVKI